VTIGDRAHEEPARDESGAEPLGEVAEGTGEEEIGALPPLPDGLLGPLLDSAGEALRRLPPAELPPAARRLRAFDRRGLATPAARLQLRRLVEEDEDLLAAAAALLLERPDAAALATAWEEATTAGGDAPLGLVSDTAAEGRLPLLASVLAVGLPAGFEFGLGLVVAMAAVAGRESDAAGAVRAAAAQQGMAEEARRRAEAARAAAEAEVARLDAALRDERRARRQLEQQAADTAAGVEARRAAIEDAAAEADRRVAAAEQRATGAEQRATAAEQRAAEAGHRAAEAEHRAAETERRVAEAECRAAEAEGRAAEVEQQAAETLRGAVDASWLQEDERATLAHVARAADELAAWLHRLADGSLPPPQAGRPSGPVIGPPPASPGRPPPPPPPPPPPRRSPSPTGRAAGRRAPVRLPPGMLQDDPAAIAAMVRTPGVAVIVDGYNVSMLAWPDASAAEQRERLCDALAEFQLRFRCEVTVVFDGAEVPGVRPLRRRGLRVVFSAAGQEADEVVVDEVMFRPEDVPVIVVSSDREVRARAEAEGATVLPADALLQLMRR
jgi:predicted RNA-binding protein with PIN domain